jgi:hypothetical protein
MSLKLDKTVTQTGTKFRIFPQPRYLESFQEPETIHVSLPPEKIGAGPQDDRMFVLDAANKTPYGQFNQRPFTGPVNPPVEPGKDGHFDHLDVDSREFSLATMYATVRRVLDIWEDYFGRPIDWHFDLDFERLELIPLINWNNAQSGYGFLEFGYGTTPMGAIDKTRPYCQNFDVLAHELGHSIIFAEVGIPTNFSNTADYGGHHEAAGDLVAIVSSLHSHMVVDHLLQNSSGNLFTVNELNRVGELSKNRQIRNAFSYERMSTVSDEPHDLSKPLTGAVFDVLVEVFQDNLVAKDLITPELAKRSYHAPDEDEDDEAIQKAFDEAYMGREEDFKQALLEARDYLGSLLARTWANLGPHHLSYGDVGLELLKADRTINGGAHQSKIRECLTWREITLPSDSIALKPHSLQTCGLVVEPV